MTDDRAETLGTSPGRPWRHALSRLRRRGGRLPADPALVALAVLVVLVAMISLGAGSFHIPPAATLAAIFDALGLPNSGNFAPEEASVLMAIRVPRVVLALAVGAGLAVSGAVMQGLFRNPLADPAVLGVSSGAALGAALAIVGAQLLPQAAREAVGPISVSASAFTGAVAVSAIVYRIGRGRGAFSVAPMLLAGIAINAAAFAGIGMLSYVATDQQLRDLTFWNLGSMSRSTWEALRVTAPVAVVGTWLLLRQAAPLNALVLGQAEARHLGVDTLRVERIVVTAVALVVGALVSVTGVIGFVGLVAPHMIRLACGPDHRVVLPGAALLGAALVAGADTVARTALAPAELPLGTLTTALGVPFFLALIARARAGEQPGG